MTNEIKKYCKVHGWLNENQLKIHNYKGRLQKKCYECELARSRAYNKKKMENPEYVEKKRARDRARWESKKEEIKEARKSEHYKKLRREWYKKNAERLRPIYRETGKKYREELADTYIRKLFKAEDKGYSHDSIPQDIVETKRLILKLKRKLKIELLTRGK